MVFSFSAAATTAVSSATPASVIYTICGDNSKLAAWEVVQRVLCQNRLWAPSDRTMLEFRHLSCPRWWMEQISSGSSTAVLHPESAGARAKSQGRAKFPCTRAADTCSEWYVEQIVDVLGRNKNNVEIACSIEHRGSSPTCQFLLFFNEFLEVMLVIDVTSYSILICT